MEPFCSSGDPVFLPDVSHVFPEFPAPDLGSVLLQESITLHDVKALQLVYRRHCEVTTLPRPAQGDSEPEPGPGPPPPRPRAGVESSAILPPVRQSALHVTRTAKLSDVSRCPWVTRRRREQPPASSSQVDGISTH